jgi:hypothetical protein
MSKRPVRSDRKRTDGDDMAIAVAFGAVDAQTVGHMACLWGWSLVNIASGVAGTANLSKPTSVAACRPIWTGEPTLPRGRTKLNVLSVKIKLRVSWTNRRSKQQASIFAVNAPHRHQEEDSVVRGIAIVLAITGALAVSGIAAPAQAGRLASTPYRCDPSDGSYPGYTPPYAYAAYRYGYPRDCGGTSIYFYFAPAYYGYRYGGPRYFHRWHHGWHRHW